MQRFLTRNAQRKGHEMSIKMQVFNYLADHFLEESLMISLRNSKPIIRG